MTIDRQRLIQLAEELERARRDDIKPKHLCHSMTATAIRACRVVIVLAENGTVENAEKILGVCSFSKESPAEDDAQAIGFWRMWLVPWVRSKRPLFFRSQKTGVTDLPEVRRNSKGGLVDKRGHSLRWEWSIKPPRNPNKTNMQRWWEKEPRGRLIGTPAKGGPLSDTGKLEDYDAADTLAHLRVWAGDWADACRALDDLVTSPDKNCDEDFKEARWFSENTDVNPGLLRQAVVPGRKKKRVRKRDVDGVVEYSVSDARKNWPGDMEKKSERNATRESAQRCVKVCNAR